MDAMKLAQIAAEEEFDAVLDATGATATSSVPDCVVRAAQAAYAAAHGPGEIEVVGRGNATHPVCSVYVVRRGRPTWERRRPT